MAFVRQFSQLGFGKTDSYADYLTWKFDEGIELSCRARLGLGMERDFHGKLSSTGEYLCNPLTGKVSLPVF